MYSAFIFYMHLEEKVVLIEQLFAEVDAQCRSFLNHVPIKCQLGCAKCCHGKNVSASPLEFLPYAYHLYTDGVLEDKYWSFKEQVVSRCYLVEGEIPDGIGKCSEYSYRGLICRLFGNAALLTKSGRKSFSGCVLLKNQVVNQSEFDEMVQQYAPVYSTYYMQLRAIDNVYGGMLLPINEAIVKAMEVVYYNTRNHPSNNPDQKVA